MRNEYICMQKTKHTHTHAYCGSKKSVVGCIIDTEFVGLF